MAKKPVRKPPVEVVTDPKSGVSVTIYYDREGKVFYGDVPSLGVVRDTDLQVVVAGVKTKLVESRSFEWKSVITVSHGGGKGGTQRSYGRARSSYRSIGAHLGFEFWRSELAMKPGAPKEKHTHQFIERPHALDVELPEAPPWLREYRENGTDIHDHMPSEGDEVLPYTEETWQALLRLKAATEATYAQLVELFKKPALLALVAARPRLLAAGRTRRHPEGSEDE